MTAPAGRDAGGRVRVPADVERPDRILAGLTARQLAILAAAAVILWAGYAATRHVLPAAVYAVFAASAGVAAVALAVGRIEGTSVDRFLAAAVGHWRAPRRLVPSADPLPAGPAGLGDLTGPTPAPLRLPVGGIDGAGLVDLGADGKVLVARASATAFSLRTVAEQEAMVAGFARWLNSLSDPVQIVIRTEPVDLRPAIDGLRHTAPGLPHPQLETAARDHARFLTDLAGGGLLARQTLIVLRHAGTDAAVDTLTRRAGDAAATLAAAGVNLEVLDRPQAAGLLARALDPANPQPLPPSPSDAPVRLTTDRSEP